MILLSSLFSPPSPQKRSAARQKNTNRRHVDKSPSPPSPNAPFDHHSDSGRLDAAFEVMFLNAAHAADGNFINDWGAVDTAEALALFCVNNARLKCCIVDALASVWGVPEMRPLQIEVCYCLLHPHCSNSLIVVHWTGGGKTHILRTLGVIERGIVMIFIPLLALSADVICINLRPTTRLGETWVSTISTR